MAYFRDLDFDVARVEQRLPIPNRFVTRDCFGLGDLLVMRRDIGIALVQVTTMSNLSAHEYKIMADPALLGRWLDSGGQFWLQGWAKRGPRGKRKTWTMKMSVWFRSYDGRIEHGAMPDYLVLGTVKKKQTASQQQPP